MYRSIVALTLSWLNFGLSAFDFHSGKFSLCVLNFGLGIYFIGLAIVQEIRGKP